MTEYRGILFFAEASAGKIDKRSLLALEKTRDLASELGVYVDAVLAGTNVDDAAKELIAYGAKKVLIARSGQFDSYDTEKLLTLLTSVLRMRIPEALIFADSFVARDMGPRLAQRFGTSFVPSCIALGVEERERKIIQTCKVFGGRVTTRLLTSVNAPQILSVKIDTSMEPCEADYPRGEVVELTDF